MPRKTAGARYPYATTAAREHDHRMCVVVDAIAKRVGDGAEEWGTPHHMPPLGSDADAHAARNKLFGARDCRRVTRARGQLSVSVMYLTDGGEYTNTRTPTERGYVLVVRVWPRDQAKREIVRRVSNGEPLTYNTLREK